MTDITGSREVCAPDYLLGQDFTLDQLKQAVADYRAAMPDFQVTLGDMIAEGDKVAYRWTMTGTHLGEYRGVAPTGRKLHATGITILHFRGGKIVRDEFESHSPSFEDQVK
ncbi:MAG: ester cyclase [Chloroflexi bacterium]|nr:ester cyclase [Chloroflexota bacterium]